MVNEKGIIKEYDLVVYPPHYVVAIGDVEKEINSMYIPYDKDYNWISFPKSTSVDGGTYTIRNKKTNISSVMVWFKSLDDFNPETVTHECDHAALEIFSYTGAKVHFDNQEPYCYLAGNMARLAYQAYSEYNDYLAKNKKKKKNGKATKDKQASNS